MSAFQLAPLDAQWGKTLLVHVLDVGTQTAQGIYQDVDGTMLHALRTRDDVFLAIAGSQIGRHETHGGSCRFDVNLIGVGLQRIDNHLCVIAVRQVLWQHVTARQRMNNQCTVRDAFRRRQLHRQVECLGGCYVILHVVLTIYKYVL